MNQKLSTVASFLCRANAFFYSFSLLSPFACVFALLAWIFGVLNEDACAAVSGASVLLSFISLCIGGVLSLKRRRLKPEKIKMGKPAKLFRQTLRYLFAPVVLFATELLLLPMLMELGNAETGLAMGAFLLLLTIAGFVTSAGAIAWAALIIGICVCMVVYLCLESTFLYIRENKKNSFKEKLFAVGYWVSYGEAVQFLLPTVAQMFGGQKPQLLLHTIVWVLLFLLFCFLRRKQNHSTNAPAG